MQCDNKMYIQESLRQKQYIAMANITNEKATAMLERSSVLTVPDDVFAAENKQEH